MRWSGKAVMFMLVESGLREQMRDGVDLVRGRKISRSDPLHRVIIGRGYHRLAEVLCVEGELLRALNLPSCCL
jgi:hypothetical protein